MGFPVGYTELFLPKLLIHVLSLLGFIRKLISCLFRTIGLGDFLESDIMQDHVHHHQSHNYRAHTHLHDQFSSVSALLIREIIPVVKFEDYLLESDDADVPDSCAVCLYEFEKKEEIRRLTNCRHIFHRACLDRWMDHDQKTCPLCRTPFIPDEMQEQFNERLWAASGIHDLYGDQHPDQISSEPIFG
ncbi:hypothetical protein Syun_013217 [Stephania yunnanensis]|uniref:RING-type domain-containing protein n=1 Tax=Stephania yunnanensis TaxID=152371 RepID=A0AAP0K0X0_9MAGN